jgi:mono/diheme cytochrome c family protein
MRPIHVLPVVLVAAALAGCGGDDGDGGSATTSGADPAQTQTQAPTETQGTRTTAPAGVDGAEVFASANCGSCHTLAAADSNGQVGPNLDDLRPDFATVRSQVENGGGGMPAFGGDLSAEEIDAVARYVSENAGQ